jgi:hypothetical protein
MNGEGEMLKKFACGFAIILQERNEGLDFAAVANSVNSEMGRRRRVV